jgi:hypothetical protein
VHVPDTNAALDLRHHQFLPCSRMHRLLVKITALPESSHQRYQLFCMIP